MRKIVNLGYGQKMSVVHKGNTMKQVTFKKNVANHCFVVISHFVKDVDNFGYTKVNEWCTQLN